MIILRREFAQLALTPAMYCVFAALTALYSYAFYGEIAATEQAMIQPVAFLMGMMALFLVPIITMRSFAGESAGGTLELLFTSPIRPIHAVLGKFAGCFLFYLLSLLPFAGYCAILGIYGEIDRGALAATVLGLALAGAAQTAAGIFVSAMTANIIVAAAGGCVLNFLFFMLSLPVESGASVFSFPAHLSWWAHFKEVFARGMADTRSLVFFVSYIVLFLFLTWLTTLSRGAFGGRKLSRGALAIAGILTAAAVNVFLFAGLAAKGWREITIAVSRPESGFSVYWPLAAAALLLLAALYFFRRAGRTPAGAEEGGRHSRIKESLPIILAAAAGVLIFANVNYLATRRGSNIATYHRWDLTANQTNTLAPSTREALDLLEEPLVISVFLSEHVDYEGLPLLRNVRDLLGEFTSYSPKVKAAFYDALADAEGADLKAKELGIPATNLTKLIVVNYGERQQILSAASLLQAPDAQQRLAGNRLPAFQGELVFSIVARRLSDRRTTNIYFAAHIGEAKAFGREPVLNSTGLLADALAREAYQLRPWAFTGKEAVPPDCDILAITGFGRPLSPAQAELIDKYLQHGGRLLLMLPEPNAATPIGAGKQYRTGLEEVLAKIGIRARGDMIFDEKNNFAGQSAHILALMDATAPINTNLPQTVLVMPNTQSLSVKEENENGWQVWRAVRSLKPSKRFQPAPGHMTPDAATKFTSGAATVAAAALHPGEPGVPEARVVVLGSTGWASNLFIAREANQAFAAAAARWLAGRHYNANVAVRDYLNYNLSLTPRDWRWIWWLTLIAFPEVWLLIGGAVWWRRRE